MSQSNARSSAAEHFGKLTFNKAVMQERLPKHVFDSLMQTIHSGETLNAEIAGVVAESLRTWAVENGATHYCHWFQPMTGSTAEKHDAFITFDKQGNLIEKFSGNQLIQAEPDASSFPSGGIRTTFEARGYTAWDASSPAFLMKGTESMTLCIPSVFISYHGEALDEKTPLLRSMRALSASAVAMLHLLGNKEATKVTTYLGAEQEYFLIDRDLYEQRPDLIMCNRTLLGKLPPKNQQLEDHYFGSIPDRVLEFMQEVERDLYELSIPAKTRHNEVAPHQFEIAPIHEETPLASDHNLLVMEVMRKVAARNGFTLLLHEKPFAGINGSGKHNNWSMGADVGGNLLDPGQTPEDNLHFLVFLVATLKAVHKRAAVLRAAIANPGNDHRLGANEAPPAIMSVFLGSQLDRVLNMIEKGEDGKSGGQQYINLGLPQIPELNKDNTDRNRTSPFAFTGNKFEFRAVPSSMPIAVPNTILNVVVAEAIDDLAESFRTELKTTNDLNQSVMNVLRKEIKATKPIRFDGDGYSDEWVKEAKKRNLPNNKTLPEAMQAWQDKSTRAVFVKYGVFTEEEIDSRYNIRLEQYVKAIDIEAKTLHQIIKTLVLPACIRYQSEVADSYGSLLAVAKAAKISATAKAAQAAELAELSDDIAALIAKTNALEAAIHKLHKGGDVETHAEFCAKTLLPAMKAVRDVADKLEGEIDRDLYPMPTYDELLFQH